MRVALTFTLLLSTVSLGCTKRPDMMSESSGRSAVPYYETLRMDLSYANLIDDPVKWTADNIAVALVGGKPAVPLDSMNIKITEVDIDHDKNPELFVWSSRHMGQAGGPVLGFRRTGDRYKYIGEVGTLCFSVLPLNQYEMPSIATYWHMSAYEGNLSIFINDGDRFIKQSSETVDLRTEAGRSRFQKFFKGGFVRDR